MSHSWSYLAVAVVALASAVIAATQRRKDASPLGDALIVMTLVFVGIAGLLLALSQPLKLANPELYRAVVVVGGAVILVAVMCLVAGLTVQWSRNRQGK